MAGNIDWSLFDPTNVKQLGDAFNPQVIAQKQNALMQAQQAQELQGINLQNARAQQVRNPIAQQQHDTVFAQQQAAAQAQQDEVVRKKGIMKILQDPASTDDMKKQALYSLYPEEVAKQVFKPTPVKDANSRFNPDGSANIPYQKYEENLIRLQAGLKEKPASEPSWQTLPTANGEYVQVNPKTGETRPLGISKASQTSPTQHIIDAKESNALLDQVEKIAPNATNSGLGAARDWMGNLVGYSTDAADAAAQLDVLGASLTAKVPKMSGPQSDKDAAMYKAAAGNVADRNRPMSQRLAAIKTIREINNRQLALGGTAGIGTNSTSGQITQPRQNIHDMADAILRGGK